MTRATSILFALVVLAGTALPAAADEPKATPPDATDPPTTAAAGEIIPGEVVVEFRDGHGPAALGARGLTVAAELGAPGKGLAALMSTGGRPVAEVIAELKADPTVAHAEPNYVVELADEGSVAAVAVNDPKTGDQYSLDKMRVRDAWSVTTGGSNVIAVLDTGVQYNHPDLAGRLLPGYDFVSNDADASDDNGHGTWVSGIIAANTHDGYGMAGISWSDKILPVKIMNREGTGSTAHLLAAITWSADQGADVINMSVGGFPYSQVMQNAVNYAFSKGAILVGAAGNNRREENFYPASFDNVISVSATQVEDEFSNWSSWGPKVDVSAPGSSVLTTNCYACTYADHDSWGTHTFISGTSFATPNVAGVVALMRARFPTSSPQQIVNQLFATVDDLGYPGWDNRYGRGRVNAYRALGASVSGPGPTTGDSVEPNNSLAAARVIGIGSISPSLHPAGDVDVFAVDLPSPGRLEARVTGVVDTRAYPWNKSGLPVDPIVELYNAAGGLLQRVDNQWESGTEVAGLNVSAPTRIFIRISNWYANGNRRAYTLSTTFVDDVPPTLTAISPGNGAVNVSHDAVTVTADFSEAVTGVSASTFQLRVAGGGPLVPASVSYASGRAALTPSGALLGEMSYTVSLNAGIADVTGNAFAPRSWTFSTGKSIARLAGSNRYATAAAVSASTFGAGVPVAYVATGASFPDALAGGPAAKIGGGPLLLTGTNSIPAETAAELRRLRPGRIVVLGGAGAVSDAVVVGLSGYAAGGVTRLAGSDRYATAAVISHAAFPGGAGTVFVATGANYPDALAAGAAAARVGAPILLVGTNSLPASTAAEIARLGPSQVFVMGGPGAVSDAVVAQLRSLAPSVQRLAGSDRYATAVALSVAMFHPNSVANVYIATGGSFPDGLSAGPVAGVNGGPLLLVGTNSLPASVANELRRLDPTNVVIVGGPGVVSDAVRNAIRALLP